MRELEEYEYRAKISAQVQEVFGPKFAERLKNIETLVAHLQEVLRLKTSLGALLPLPVNFITTDNGSQEAVVSLFNSVARDIGSHTEDMQLMNSLYDKHIKLSEAESSAALSDIQRAYVRLCAYVEALQAVRNLVQ